MARVAPIAAVLLLAASCAPRALYRPPPASAPHAEVDVEVLVSAADPATLVVSHTVRVDGQLATSTRRLPEREWGHFVRIAPGVSTWEVSAHVQRERSRPVTRTYTEYVSYGCIGTTPCTRPITRTRTEMELVRTTVSRCRREGELDARAGRVYLLQLRAGRSCAIRCFEQVPVGPGDQVELRPCPSAGVRVSPPSGS